MGIEELFLDYGVEIAPESHKHYRQNWINTECPFCEGNPGYHLGFNERGKYFVCFRCGGKSLLYTLCTLLSVDKNTAGQLAKDYRIYTGSGGESSYDKDSEIGILPFKFPSNITELKKPHIHYLTKKRKHPFDVQMLQKEYDIMGSGPGSYLKKKDGSRIAYRYRIVIPIYWNNRVVSFQTRDYTGKQDLKYLTCPMEREVIHHKYITYCKQGKMPEKVGIWEEGVFDVWRTGSSAFCTFGIEYTDTQMQLIASKLKRCFIWFDPDKQAGIQANKIYSELKFRGVEPIIIDAPEDPADMPQKEVDYIVRQLNIRL